MLGVLGLVFLFLGLFPQFTAQDWAFLDYSVCLCQEGAPRFPSHCNQLQCQDRDSHLHGAEPGIPESLNAMLNEKEML